MLGRNTRPSVDETENFGREVQIVPPSKFLYPPHQVSPPPVKLTLRFSCGLEHTFFLAKKPKFVVVAGFIEDCATFQAFSALI
jgi:hypothetical protein